MSEAAYDNLGAAETAVVDAARALLRREGLLSPTGAWLAAVSGGPDSMVLLEVMRRLQAESGQPQSLHIAHLNHGLREQAADADAAFVQEYAARLGLPCTVERADIKSQQRQGESVEMAARRVRYEFLARTARATGCVAVAVGHHTDDQAETVLFRILRGCGLRGLAGMAAQRPLDEGRETPLILIRPLLEVRRAAIEAYCRAAGIAFRQDETNLDGDYVRNRLRSEAMPLLNDIMGGEVTERLTRLASIAGLWRAAQGPETAAWLAEAIVATAPGLLVLDAQQLCHQTAWRQTEVLWAALDKLGTPLGDVGYEDIRAVLALLEAGPGGRTLPGNVDVHLDGGDLVLERRSAAAALPETPLAAQGITELPPGYFCFDAQGRQGQALTGVRSESAAGVPAGVVSADRRVETMDAARLQGPLRVRPWQPGERMQLLGAAGAKTVGDIFTDRKVPRWRRGRLAIISDDQGPVWLAGIGIADRVKITDGARQSRRLRLITSDNREAIPGPCGHETD